ncbi:hypothetical protein DB346_10170 [Verrucomicrobia bacterium LW23]|nr:hypothetical protein DB346_10170 [Verrucomicrobia bacterium LW23]
MLVRYSFVFEYVLAALILSAVMQAGAANARACGMGWKEPESYFDGVSSRGNVQFVERIGDVATSKASFQLPLYAVFNSSSDRLSPYVGYGYEVPLLESRIVQQEEGTFRLNLPDGWYLTFRRDRAQPSVLNGGAEWKAEIQADTITVVAECGLRLVYHKGRIISMKVKDQTFDYLYDGDVVTEVREGNTTLIRVIRSDGGLVSGFRLNNSTEVRIGQDSRPRVEVLNGQKVVGGMYPGLGTIAFVGTGNDAAHQRTITYGLDKDRNPTLTIKGVTPERRFVWDPATRLILADSAWTYEIVPAKSARENAAIRRTNAEGKSEYWFKDVIKGNEKKTDVDGISRVTYWISDGVLAGAVRKIEETGKGTTRVLYQATYDEKGYIIREVLEDGGIKTIQRNEDGRALKETVTKDGKPDYEIVYDTKVWRVALITSSTGTIHQFEYDDMGREIRMKINNRLHSEVTYSTDNTRITKVIFNKELQVPERTFTSELDSLGRVIREKVTEHIGKVPGQMTEYSYHSRTGVTAKTIPASSPTPQNTPHILTDQSH